MNDDVEIPETIPTKRRQLHLALDKWIAVWLDRADLSPTERRRLEEERARRKALKPDPVTLGLLVGPEGATPSQLATVQELVQGAEPGEVLAPGRIRLGLPPGVFAPEANLKEIVRGATQIVAAPKTFAPTPGEGGVWGMIRYARHRRLPVHVVLPDGQVQQQEGDGG